MTYERQSRQGSDREGCVLLESKRSRGLMLV